MSVSILLALGAMIAGAFADLIYKVAQNRGINSTTFVFYQSTVFAFTIFVIAFATGQIFQINGAALAFGIPIGFIGYLGVLLFVMSLRDGSASVNVPIFRLSFVITSLGAIFILGEPANTIKVVGTLLAIAGVLSLADLSTLKTTARRDTRLRTMLLLLTATLAFGIGGVLNKEATNQGAMTIPLILVSTISFSSSAVTRMIIGRQFRPNATTIRFAPMTGLLQLTWTGLLIQSLQTGDASITFPIVQLSFVLTSIMAVVFLKEAVSKRLVIGLTTATVAVITFAFA